MTDDSDEAAAEAAARQVRRRRRRRARLDDEASEGADEATGDEVGSASEGGGAEGGRSLEELLRDLEAAEAERRRRAARAIGALGPKARDAAGPLARVLDEDADEQVRYRAARALGKLGPEAAAALPALVRALASGTKDRSRDERSVAGAAASAIKRVGGAAASHLVTALGERPLRRRAARLLRSVPLPADDPALAEAWGALLARERGGAPLAGVEALAQRGDDAAPLLVEALGAVREEAAEAAAAALVALERAAVKPLARALSEARPGVRLGAANALRTLAREVGQRDVAKAGARLVKAATEDDDPEVRGAAIEALGSLTEHADLALPGLIRALGDDDSRNSLKAVMGLLDLELDKAALVQRMVEVVQGTRRVFTRVGACMVLMHLGQRAKPAAPALVAALEDASPEVREYAHLALQSIRTPSMRLQVIRTASLRLKVVDEPLGSGERRGKKERSAGREKRRAKGRRR